MATYTNLNAFLDDIGNAIRYKSNTTAPIVGNNFPNAINNIINVQEGTPGNAVAGDILSPKVAWVNGTKLTGTIATKTSANITVSGRTVTAEAGYYASAVSNSVATTTHPAPSINKASFNATSGNVEITANHVQSTGYVTGGTTSASTNVTVGIASVNAPSGSKAQSTPTFSINTTTGIVTASVAATSGTAYANVTNSGYIASATKSGAFTMSASSNTYNAIAGLGTTSRVDEGSSTGLTSALVTNAANGAVDVTKGVNWSSTAVNGYYRIRASGWGKVSTGTGYITSGSLSTATNYLSYYLKSSNAVNTTISPYTNGTDRTVTFSNGYVTNDTTVTITGVATATRSAGTASVLNNSNGNVRYYVNTTAGYTAANTTAYYLQLNTKAGGLTTLTNTTTMTLINAGQFATGDIKAKVEAGAIESPIAVGDASITSMTIAYNSTLPGYEVTGSSNISGVSYRNITTAGLLAKDNTAGTVLGTATLSAVLPKADITANILSSTGTAVTTSRAPVLRYGGVPSGTVNAAGGAITTTAPTSGPYVTVNSPANTATAYAYINQLGAGYTDGNKDNTWIAYNSKACGAAAMANRYIPIKVGTVTTTQGTASGATVTGYVNITQGWSEAQNIAVSGTVASATRSAGSASVLNNHNGNVRYYVNTTAGYTAANTTAYYINVWNNFAAVYTTANCDLSCPMLTVA